MSEINDLTSYINQENKYKITNMVWILIICWICQLISTLVSLLEVAKSEYDSRNTIDWFFSSQASLLPTVSLLDDVMKLRYMCYMLKYAGAMVLSVGFCVLTRQCLKTRFSSVNDIWRPIAQFMSLQLIGVVALCIRIVMLLLYTIRHVCDADEGRSLEPNYVMLGIAAIFGLISIFIYIGHVFVFTYNKCLQHEKYSERRRANLTFTNMYEIAVYTHVNTPSVSHDSGYRI